MAVAILVQVADKEEITKGNPKEGLGTTEEEAL